MGLFKSQSDYDKERKTYIVRFPGELPVDAVQAMFRVIHTTLPLGSFTFIMGRPSLVLEAWALNGSMEFRLLVPWQYAEQVTSQIRHQIPGSVIEDDVTRPRKAWTYVEEITLSDSTRTLNVNTPEVISKDILTNLAHALGDGESAVLQWVIAPAGLIRKPSTEHPVTSTRHGIVSEMLGQTASREEVEDRRKKLDYDCYEVIARVAAQAKTEARAKFLTGGIFKGLKTANSQSTWFLTKKPVGDIDVQRDTVNSASTPWRLPSLLNVPELAAVAGFPLGDVSMPGLARSQARQFYATEEIARVGLVFGTSNHSSQKGRRIAQGYGEKEVLHMHIGGKPGTGKSVTLGNSAAQNMANGYGVVGIDASNSNSPETFFNRTLNYIPFERLDDVIIVNVSDMNPVGFNPLDQGNAHKVVDQISAMFQQLYPDSKGVWTRELIHHGLYALIEYGNATLIDLLPLLRPRTPEEVTWARSVVSSVKDRQIKYFMDDWMNLKEEERRVRSQPLYDRLWQLNSRPEIYNILGQTKSGFNIKDVLLGNKILLINLAGLPEDTSALLASLFFQALWTEAQNLTPDKYNFIYLDEAQQMTKSNVPFDDVLSQARKHKFILTTSTQYMDDSDRIDRNTRSAILNNTGTKVLFESTAKEARMWLNSIGSSHVTETDITGLKKYDAIAWIANERGTGDPVTFTALAPFPSLGTADRAMHLSGIKHGTPIAKVHEDIDNRRRARVDETHRHPNMGRRKKTSDDE
ncbi:type IV secretory system conjugative DNA transfer family protein [Pseudarthrobacter sp902506025]|uniref:type IV secretory system conjugative DNA transfer family protein n=1 Tax=Pseudarthrobacter sp. 902506025 TaxID=3155291 RepID=UPI00345055FC